MMTTYLSLQQLYLMEITTHYTTEVTIDHPTIITIIVQDIMKDSITDMDIVGGITMFIIKDLGSGDGVKTITVTHS